MNCPKCGDKFKPIRVIHLDGSAVGCPYARSEWRRKYQPEYRTHNVMEVTCQICLNWIRKQSGLKNE